MAHAPATLLKALDLLTRALEPQIEALGAVRRSHISRVRSITEDKNIVALGISEKESDGERTGELSVCFYSIFKLETGLSSKSSSWVRCVTTPAAAMQPSHFQFAAVEQQLANRAQRTPGLGPARVAPTFYFRPAVIVRQSHWHGPQPRRKPASVHRKGARFQP